MVPLSGSFLCCCSSFLAMSLPPPPAPTNASYHYKAFSGEYQRVEGALERLEASGYYWGALSGSEAKQLLTSQAVGTFLIRDSSDHHHLFTLSVRTEAGITNLRIKQKGCTFYLETDSRAKQPPTFECVVRLVCHYMRLTAEGSAGRNLCRIEGKETVVPLTLTRPLLSKVTTLQHLCRNAVLRNVCPEGAGGGVEDLPVPRLLRNALKP
ncbi:suppressor of cytokine signaling 3-like [Latimeria chalumnae]|uniref:Suppressor of cytokine signaling 3a n=1 Tax=Latimeria chalumnae TaxID=7897 RepID=H3ATA7_LATCH|nr:PREDICTED: suppressor of cytokine signaling 3-like [Latimeria chalumnae]|eukprot:XP_006000688.1 PREDICTED: suppressor of cytokine signaling 3-like [Latimeria chalumnae]